MSDTPRTDYELKNLNLNGWIRPDFARNLERELAAVHRNNARLREDAHSLAHRVRDTQDVLESFEQDASDKPTFWPSSDRVKRVIEANRIAMSIHLNAIGKDAK